jgi:hypothetical protein
LALGGGARNPRGVCRLVLGVIRLSADTDERALGSSWPQTRQDTTGFGTTPFCWIQSDPGRRKGTVKGTVFTDRSDGDLLWVQVTATLYWSAGNSPFSWQKQNPTATDADVYDATATATHSCTRGTTHWWHVRNDTLVEDEDTGTEYQDHQDSPNGFLPLQLTRSRR